MIFLSFCWVEFFLFMKLQNGYTEQKNGVNYPFKMFCGSAVGSSTRCTRSPLLHPIATPSLPSATPLSLAPLFQLVHSVATSVRLSACHPRVMPLSQPLGALLTQKQPVFAQSFGSRIWE